MRNARLAVWVFGPVGAGKSHVLARLPLEHFQLVDQDSELERRLLDEGIPGDTRTHGPHERQRFAEVRREVIRGLWDRVPEWRARGENLAFETTGNKPEIFREALAAGRAQGYANFGCALRRPLDECLSRNRDRTRVLADEIVHSTWRAFEQGVSDGVYRELFTGDTLAVCKSSTEAIEAATAWISERLGHAQ